mmetsp:Transcript_42724/g.110099  ORF Transcript_42724/g.110099 Transcript_42724/m.110099 type:complete len:217 (-) Transcript_42724:95-745(-)
MLDSASNCFPVVLFVATISFFPSLPVLRFCPLGTIASALLPSTVTFLLFARLPSNTSSSATSSVRFLFVPPPLLSSLLSLWPSFTFSTTLASLGVGVGVGLLSGRGTAGAADSLVVLVSSLLSLWQSFTFSTALASLRVGVGVGLLSGRGTAGAAESLVVLVSCCLLTLPVSFLISLSSPLAGSSLSLTTASVVLGTLLGSAILPLQLSPIKDLSS